MCPSWTHLPTCHAHRDWSVNIFRISHLVKFHIHCVYSLYHVLSCWLTVRQTVNLPFSPLDQMLFSNCMEYMLSLGGQVRKHFKAPHCHWHTGTIWLGKKIYLFLLWPLRNWFIKKHFCGEFLSLICGLLWSSSHLAIQNLVGVWKRECTTTSLIDLPWAWTWGPPNVPSAWTLCILDDRPPLV